MEGNRIMLDTKTALAAFYATLFSYQKATEEIDTADDQNKREQLKDLIYHLQIDLKEIKGQL